MNTKRWVAIGIACGLLLFSVVTNTMTASINSQRESLEANTLNRWIYGSNELTKSVIDEGKTTDEIVKLTLDGTIQSSSTSLFSSEGYDHSFFMEQLDAIIEDTAIKAVLLEVNTPGGGVYESAEIARKLNEIQTERKIPIYVSMGSMAASGGYYISARADKIFASEETVTGSIGVIMTNLNYTGLLDKLGIEDTTVKSGTFKDIGSTTRKSTAEDKEILQSYIDSAYGRFVNIVSEGRGISEEETRKIADGRIYDGIQAKEVGLVDEIGFSDEALLALRADQNLENASLVTYESGLTGFASTWFGAKLAQFQGIEQSETGQLLAVLKNMGTQTAPKAMYYYGGE